MFGFLNVVRLSVLESAKSGYNNVYFQYNTILNIPSDFFISK